MRILHDRAEAEEVLQETFLQVWRRVGDVDDARGGAVTWLVTIARSGVLDRFRASASRGRVASEAAQMPRDEVGDAAEDALRSEQGKVVRQALTELASEQ